MATVTVVLYTKTPLKTKNEAGKELYPVKIRIIHKQKTTFLSTGIAIPEGCLSGSDVINISDAKVLNKRISHRINKIKALIDNLELSGKLNKLAVTDIRKLIETNGEEPEQTAKEEKTNDRLKITDHFERYMSSITNDKTKDLYRETYDKITKFSPDKSLEQIDYAWLTDFESFLAPSCGVNSRAIHLRNIRAVFNDAINRRLVELNYYPFRSFKIKKEKTIKRTLSIEQLKVFRDYPVQKHQERYRDLAMLNFYLIGINMIDLLHLTEIINGRIEYKRAKTGRLYSIEVLPEAMAIFERYKGKKYLLNVLDEYYNYKDFTARMNENLKQIGELEWVKNKAKNPRFAKNNVKKITPLFPELIIYTFRRTWATIASGLDIPKDTIAAALGHGGNTTTDLYIMFDNKKVDEANRKVIKAISY